MHEVQPGQVGYGTDFTGVSVRMRPGSDGPDWDNTGLYGKMSTPPDAVAAPKRKPRPR